MQKKAYVCEQLEKNQIAWQPIQESWLVLLLVVGRCTGGYWNATPSDLLHIATCFLEGSLRKKIAGPEQHFMTVSHCAVLCSTTSKTVNAWKWGCTSDVRARASAVCAEGHRCRCLEVPLEPPGCDDVH